MRTAVAGQHAQQAGTARPNLLPVVAAGSHCRSAAASLTRTPAAPRYFAAGDHALIDQDGGNTNAHGGHHQPVPEVEGLLHRDQHAAFPIYLPEGQSTW